MEKLWVSKEVRLLLNASKLSLVIKSPSIEITLDALNILKWQAVDEIEKVDNIEDATYKIITDKEYRKLDESVDKYRTQDNRWYIVFESTSSFDRMMKKLKPSKKYTWTRKYSEENPGYEVTSRGDRRFSPFFMKWKVKSRELTLEDYWKEFIKPLPPEEKVGTAHKVFGDYLTKYMGLFYELAVIGLDRNLTDMFDVNGGQNLTYCDLLNSYYNLD